VRWVLLLRAVNVGGNNKIAMKDLSALLVELGHDDVRTYLNSGNATFESTERSATRIAEQVESALRERHGLDVRACARKDADIRAALDALPDLPGYVTVNVLFDKPTAGALRDFLAADWSPEVVKGDAQNLYIGFASAAKTKLTLAKIEKSLGVSATARTPATLRKMLA
jgi:uncharacterized protein (DUF1697 family)